MRRAKFQPLRQERALLALGPAEGGCGRGPVDPDPTAQVAAIASGQVDITWDLPRVGLGSLENNPDVKLSFTRTPFVMSLAMWADTAPFDDVRVREAMKYVVDRDKMVQLVLGGHGQVGDDQPVASSCNSASRTSRRPRDVEKAKALLAAAGHRNGLQVDLHTSEAVIRIHRNGDRLPGNGE